jgi:hypothetical protein
MNIKIVGTDDYSSEYNAAIELQKILQQSFTQLKGNIFIKPNLTFLGGNVEQLDLLVWGTFENGFTTPYNSELVRKNGHKISFQLISLFLKIFTNSAEVINGHCFIRFHSPFCKVYKMATP